jgi:DNA-binding FadR family transcriptional regulator
MPLHWSVAEAVGRGDEQAAEEAMRKLVLLTADDVHRALSYHTHDNGEPLSGSSWFG